MGSGGMKVSLHASYGPRFYSSPEQMGSCLCEHDLTPMRRERHETMCMSGNLHRSSEGNICA